jgi:DNA-binding NarL/FixJ family response regulator
MEPATNSTLPSLRTKSVRLILIEDSDADAFLLTEAALQLSYDLSVRRFSTATHAINGIEDALAQTPHGVLLDLNLPSGSGLDVLRFIRGSERCRNLRVVVMTSSISPRDREAAERLGIEGFVVKPSDYDQFVITLEGALRMLCDEPAQEPQPIG